MLSSEEDSIAEHAGVVLTSNQGILQTLLPMEIGDGNTTPPVQQIPTDNHHPFEKLSNCLVAIIWMDSRDKKQWFLGCITEYQMAVALLASDRLQHYPPGKTILKPENLEVRQRDAPQLYEVVGSYSFELFPQLI